MRNTFCLYAQCVALCKGIYTCSYNLAHGHPYMQLMLYVYAQSYTDILADAKTKFTQVLVSHHLCFKDRQSSI
jgi:hypothetical protein